MSTPSLPRKTSRHPDAADLERLLSAVERDLDALGTALRLHDCRRIEQHAGTLRSALALAIEGFGRASRAGQMPPALRLRLVQASAQVAQQREVLLRTSHALDSAMEVLLPRVQPVVYEHPGRSGATPFRH